MGPTKETCWKILVTISLIGVWICMGLYMEIAGPTLKDFKFRLGVSYETLSSAVSGRSIGKFIGVVLGGFAVDKFSSMCHLVNAVSLTMAATATFLLPWITNTDVLWGAYIVLGTTIGLIDIAGQRIVLTVWKDKAASPMHIVHLGYEVGGFIAPLIVNPFLADLPDADTEFTSESPSTTARGDITTARFLNRTDSDVDVVSNIQYGYTIIGIITAVFALIFYLYQFRSCCKTFCKTDTNEDNDKKKQPENDKNNTLLKKRSLLQMINPATCADGNLCFGLSILILLFVRYFFIVGLDREIGTFLRSFSIDQLHFSKDNASYINTVYWVAYAASRFTAFVVAHWVSVKVLMIVESIGLLATGIFLTIFALDNTLSLWILTGCSGFLLGPMFPTGIAWGDAHIEMTGLAITWVLLGSAVGGLAYLQLGGFAYDKYGPPSFVYVFIGTAGLIMFFDIVLTVLGLSKKKITRKEYKLDEKDNTKEPGVNTDLDFKYNTRY